MIEQRSLDGVLRHCIEKEFPDKPYKKVLDFPVHIDSFAALVMSAETAAHKA